MYKNSTLQPNEFTQLQKSLGLNESETLLSLVEQAKNLSISPISKFKVGAVALAKSGRVYLGTNLEFPKMPLQATVHAEQFVIARAQTEGEAGIHTIALSSAPCGHCRQFLSEVSRGSQLKILIANRPPIRLMELLPAAFGPADLGISKDLLAPKVNLENTKIFAPDLDQKLITAALEGLSRSYAPYTMNSFGAAVRTKDQQYFFGACIENAAYNPSLTAMTEVFINLTAAQIPYSEIDEAILISQTLYPGGKDEREWSRILLNSTAPNVKLHLLSL